MLCLYVMTRLAEAQEKVRRIRADAQAWRDEIERGRKLIADLSARVERNEIAAMAWEEAIKLFAQGDGSDEPAEEAEGDDGFSADSNGRARRAAPLPWDAIMGSLQREKGATPFDYEALIDAVARMGFTVKMNTMRTTVANLVGSGAIQRVRDGLFRFPPAPASPDIDDDL